MESKLYITYGKHFNEDKRGHFCGIVDCVGEYNSPIENPHLHSVVKEVECSYQGNEILEFLESQGFEVDLFF